MELIAEIKDKNNFILSHNGPICVEDGKIKLLENGEWTTVDVLPSNREWLFFYKDGFYIYGSRSQKKIYAKLEDEVFEIDNDDYIMIVDSHVDVETKNISIAYPRYRHALGVNESKLWRYGVGVQNLNATNVDLQTYENFIEYSYDYQGRVFKGKQMLQIDEPYPGAIESVCVGGDTFYYIVNSTLHSWNGKDKKEFAIPGDLEYVELFAENDKVIICNYKNVYLVNTVHSTIETFEIFPTDDVVVVEFYYANGLIAIVPEGVGIEDDVLQIYSIRSIWDEVSELENVIPENIDPYSDEHLGARVLETARLQSMNVAVSKRV